MNSAMTTGLVVALGAGMAIGFQQVFITNIGQMSGPVGGGLAIHIGGSIIGAIMLGFVLILQPHRSVPTLTPQVIPLALLAGTTGMLMLIAIAFAFPRIGNVSGQATLIFAQMGVAVLIETFALAGGNSTPLDWRRGLGLLVMGLGTYLLLPRQS
jgi:uncharacterized membrane protein YdcZ (DUF606 family)